MENENGVMRIKGRLDAAESISFSAKRPIILDRHHYVTYLIVYFYHQKYKHLHHQTVLNEVNQKYHIPKLRVLLGTIVVKNAKTLMQCPRIWKWLHCHQCD